MISNCFILFNFIFVLVAISETRKTLVRSEVFVFLNVYSQLYTCTYKLMYITSFYVHILGKQSGFGKTLNILEMAIYFFVFLLGPVNFSFSFCFAFLLFIIIIARV